MALIQAHRYVLRHSDEIQSFRDEFIAFEKRQRCRARLTNADVYKLINEKFRDWFRVKVAEPDFNAHNSAFVAALGRGPNNVARRFSGLSVNGFRFRTKSREVGMATQNSGVVNVSEDGGVNYYDAFKVILFKCDWVNVLRKIGMKKDEYGIIFLNFNHLIHTGDKLEDDPYVFSQLQSFKLIILLTVYTFSGAYGCEETIKRLY